MLLVLPLSAINHTADVETRSQQGNRHAGDPFDPFYEVDRIGAQLFVAPGLAVLNAY